MALTATEITLLTAMVECIQTLVARLNDSRSSNAISEDCSQSLTQKLTDVVAE
jgi:hypothetical protein